MSRNPLIFPRALRATVEPLLVQSPSIEVAHQVVDLLMPMAQNALCERAIETVDDILDLKNKKVHVSYCETHHAFHSFDPQYAISAPLKKVRESNLNRLYDLLRYNHITTEQYENGKANWGLIKRLVHNDGTLPEEKLHPFLYQALIYSRKLRGRAKYFDPERQLPEFTYVDDLSDEEILCWYQCKRKSAFISPELVPAGALNNWKCIYKCNHCDQYHVGSGTRPNSEAGQLSRAKRMLELIWNSDINQSDLGLWRIY